MDEKLTNLLAAATDESLMKWTDPKMVGRAYGYLDKVDGLSFIEGKGIVAKVHGSEDYYTRVFGDETGNLESRCSCPVGHRCKHAVAVIARASRQLGEGGQIAEQSAGSEFWQTAETAFEKVNARLLERERKILEQRAAKEREEAEVLRRQEERRAAWFELFNRFLEKIRERQKSGDVKGLLNVLDEACSETGYFFDIEYYGGELYDLVHEMSRIALDAINASDMSDKDKLLYAHDAEVPYRYYVPPRLIYDEFWSGRQSQTFSKDVWSEVGDTLKSKLDDSSFAEECDYHEFCFTVYDVCCAYWRAEIGRAHV